MCVIQPYMASADSATPDDNRRRGVRPARDDRKTREKTCKKT
jgi:hypothetical protein